MECSKYISRSYIGVSHYIYIYIYVDNAVHYLSMGTGVHDITCMV